jgi:hypothetical protein
MEMTKIVINRCHGGFGLSDKAVELYGQLKNINLIRQDRAIFAKYGSHWYVDEVTDANYFSYYNIERNDPILVRVVEELGEEANNRFAELKVVEIPDDVKWEINEYEGVEHVAEKHRTWS